MNEPRSKVADVFATVRARAIDYARRLAPAQRDRLAAWAAVGTAAPRPGDDPVEACVAAACAREGTRRILASIDRDAREALLFFLCGTEILDVERFEEHVRDFFGWPRARAHTAVEALFAAGLLARGAPSSYAVDAFPALRLGLGGELLDWLAGATEDAAPTMPFARRLALLVAHAQADPVTLTAQRVLAVRWIDRATEVFAASGFSARLLAACVAFLGRTGALGPDPTDAEAKAWRVEPQAEATLASDPADLGLAFADGTESSAWGTTFGTLVLLERARLAGEDAPTIPRLSELGRAWVAEPRDVFLPYFESQFRPLAIASSLRALRSLGLVTFERGAGGLRVRATRPATSAGGASKDATSTPSSGEPRPFRCTVLPTFEIWVPEHADPVGTADLGRIADLTSTDRVAKFTLSQKSVARAAREPGGVAAAIERLAAAAEHGLPDNVRATLEGWARRATSIRAFRGGVIVAGSDEHAVFLRGRTGVLSEIAPGVFHVDSDSLTDVLRAAEKAGHVTSPVVRDGQPSGHPERYVDTRPLAERAADTRAKLDGLAKPMAPKPTPRATARAESAPRPKDVAPYGAGARPRTLRDLRDGWPLVAAAVRGYPPVEEVALRLPDGRLDELGSLDSPTAIRGRIARYAFESVAPDLEDADEADEADDVASERAPTPAPVPTPVAVPVAAPPSPSTPVASASAASVPADSSPWFTPTPGELAQLLAVGALRHDVFEIVCVSASGTRSEERIVPLAVVYAGQREWLTATRAADGATIRVELDRIVALRPFKN